MKVAFYTLGCKLNQAETESLVNDFRLDGFHIVSPDALADIYIANTCTITHIADRKSRHWLRVARRKNPQALVIATGCYAQRSRQELARLADLVAGNDDKENLVDLTRAFLTEAQGLAEDDTQRPQPSYAGTRVRSLIRIQDGCHSSCTYCIVPHVRPQEFSLPPHRIVGEIQDRVARGYREVVLTGTKIGSYWSKGTDLRGLVQHVLRSIPIERLRISSLQPSDIYPDFLTLWEDERLCQHFHLALQSGSSTVLRRMGRGYSPDDYRRALDLIRDRMPESSITTDIIVGFPGESDEEFEQSYSFCRESRFANIHLFPFSARPGTAAADMPERVEVSVRRERNRRMLELSREARLRYYERFLGRTMQVLWEKETDPGRGIYSGLTANYLRVFAGSDRSLSNELTPARLLEARAEGMQAEVMNVPALR
ncbi:MAG: tRNA (N(6)-L-threonylcarbamoyladenosine(37)-C(2))-methylthiotransferase MtaB [Dehalococcoidia bacterium]